MSVFMNGVLGGGGGVTATFSGTLGGSSSYLLAIGNLQNSASYTTYGYISNLRMVQGTALYTTSFTPPTAPLQPIQGVTQAGTPYGTVLLLRNAPAPGRVLTQRFAGANSSSVLAFPPAPMTGYLTTINAGYGQGVYVASASSDQYAGSTNYSAWQAFNKGITPSKAWATPAGFDTSSPYGPSGVSTTSTIDVNGTSYAGEWLQIQLPTSTVLANYQLNPGYAGLTTQTPAKWWFFGSPDGTSWYLLDSRVGYSGWVAVTNSTFTLSIAQAFTYYRIVVNTLTGASGIAVLSQVTLNGTIESVNITADGRVGLGVVAPVQALEVAGSAVVTGTVSSGTGLMFRNRVINGDMRIDQRNGGASVTNGVNDIWLLDRFLTVCRLASKLSFQQSSIAPPGFTYSLLVTSLTAYTPVTSDFYGFCQRIEGYNIGDLNWGTLNALPITISFWIRSSVSGNYVLNIQNAYTRSYTVTYTISGVNAWQYVKLTIPGDITGTWNTTNGMGMRVWFDLGSSDTSYAVTTPGVWQAGDKVRVSGATNFVSTNGATLYITGIQLEKGTIATPFEFRPYDVELQLCKRYFQKLPNMIAHGLDASSMLVQCIATVEFRSSPSPSLTTTSPVWESTPWSAAATASTVGLGGGHLNVLGGDILISGTFTPSLVKNTVYIFNRDQIWLSAEL